MRKLLTDLQGLKTLTRFIARDQRATVRDLEREVMRLGDLVDAFYSLLGERNWIYHDDLEVSLVERLVGLPSDQAERTLIESYKDPESLRLKVLRLSRFPELQARMPLLQRAAADFHAGRYYATVQVLLSVMDGFVNDLEPSERRGLHAREANELHAWDSVVGHHLGLTHAHRSFTKTFKKRSDEEVTELYRHGIVHGMLTNYDNDIVAAKAWNRLFAVADWASSRMRQQTPPKPKSTWRETLRLIIKNAEAQRALDAWHPSSSTAADPGFEENEAVILTRHYLDAWRARNFGVMAGLLSPLVAESTVGQTAGLVREAFAEVTLSNRQLTRVEHPAAAVILVDADLEVNGRTVQCRLRWIRGGSDGLGVAPNEDGSWRLMTWSFWAMQSERTDNQSA